MGDRSYDSETRFAILSVPAPGIIKGEAYADEGTLIMEPAAPSVPPPPLSSMRPPMDSWGDRAWSIPVSDRTGASGMPMTMPVSAAPARPARSSSALILLGAAAAMAALASVVLVNATAQDAPRPAAASAVAVPSTPAVFPPAPQLPVAPPVAEPAPPVAAQPVVTIEVAPSAPPPSAPAVAAPKPVSAPRVAPSPAAKPAPKPVAAKPSGAAHAQAKTLEELLDQLGEEQLKR